MLAMAAVAACEPAGKNLPAELDESYAPVSISAKDSKVFFIIFCLFAVVVNKKCANLGIRYGKRLAK